MPSSAESKSLFGLDGQHNGTLTLANPNSTTGSAAGTITHSARGTAFHQTRIDISGTLNLAAINGSSNGVTGVLELFKFPPGLLLLSGAVGSLTLTAAGANSTQVAATAAAVVALGTSPASATTLTGTCSNMIQSTAFTFAASTKSGTLINSGSANFIDNTVVNNGGTTSYACLNVAIPGTGATGGTNVNLTVIGWIDFTWANISFNEL